MFDYQKHEGKKLSVTDLKEKARGSSTEKNKNVWCFLYFL